ncbi:helix-turn-helix domain-containing protein [Acidovorax sp. Root402]|uniref:helix-turn-helix transcriptional regulator n=1 Tax=Acidovorax sp. Root402 TaxID=1736527 RepID=UPI0009EC777E
MRSEIRRLRGFDLEQVSHQQHGQEWVPHWHDEWSFGAVVRGECRCIVGGQPFGARSGDLIAISPGTVHTGALTAPDSLGGVLVTMLYVPAEWFAREGLAPPARSGVVQSPRLAGRARELDSAEKAQSWMRDALPLLCDELAPRAGVIADPIPSQSVRSLIQKVQVAVLSGETSVAGLALHCSVSRERLHRVSRDWLGMAPGEYLRAVRLHRAKQLLLDGRPLASIAADCGFSDQAHFTRWFRKTFGYSPGDLQEALQERG